MAGPSNPVAALLHVLVDRISDHQLFRYIAGLWQTDRWFTNPMFERTHAWAVEQMLAAGADEAEVVRIPADGRTRYENFTMPMAFDCRGGRLEIVEPGYRLLADWSQTPQCVVQWCGPTPAEGVIAPLVAEESLDAREAGAARGRIVLTAKSGRDLREQLHAWGAAGVVSYYLPDYITDREHVTCWTNAWSIEPGGWVVHAGEPPMPGFNLPPALGRQLADRLAAGDRIVVRAWADTRVYEGVLPVSTGVIRGSDPSREVLVLGHAAEVGANDNASGCAAMLETIRVLAGLIRDGKLRRPRRSIRVLLTSEIFGMIGYSGLRDSIGNTVAALHLDIVGDGPTAERPIVLFEQGPTNASYANELVCLIHASMPSRLGGPGLPFLRQRYAGVADDMVGDPAFGPACPWIGRPVKTNPNYHSSGDTLEVINPVAMMHSAGMAAAYAYFVASAGDDEARWLAQQMIAAGASRRVDRPQSDAEHMANYRAKAEALRCGELAESSGVAAAIRELVERAMPGFDVPVADLEGTPAVDDERLIVERVTRGVLAFQGQGREVAGKFPWVNWDQKLASTLYWANGQRNIAQLRRLAEAEWSPAKIKTDVVSLFKAAAACGMVRLK